VLTLKPHAGLIEGDDSSFSTHSLETRGRGAAGTATVVVAVETYQDKPGFGTIQKSVHLRVGEISQVLRDSINQEVVSGSDG